MGGSAPNGRSRGARAALGATAVAAAIILLSWPVAANSPPRPRRRPPAQSGFYKAVADATAPCAAAADRAGTFGHVQITFKSPKQFSVKAAKLLGPSATACITRSIRQLVAHNRSLEQDWDVYEDEYDSRPGAAEVNLFFGKARPVLPEPDRILPAWKARDRRELARMLPPGVAMDSGGCLVVDDQIAGGMEEWLKKWAVALPYDWWKLFRPAQLPNLVGRDALVVQNVVDGRGGPWCLLPLDERWQAALRARLDEEGSCWHGDVAEILSAPRASFPTDRRYRAVSVARKRACAIDEAGEIVCCGSPRPPPPPRGPFQQLSVSDVRACALRPDGSAVCWANPDLPKVDPPPGRYVSISVSTQAVCARQANGRFECRGQGVPNEMASGVAKVVAIDDYLGVLALGENGELTFSKGYYQGLPAPSPVVDVSFNSNVCVLNPAGEVLCPQVGARGPWGLVSRDHFRQIAMSSGFGCGRRADDTVRCWGWTGPSGTLPPPEARFTSLEAGIEDMCGVRADGHIACWGPRSRGAYGLDFE